MQILARGQRLMLPTIYAFDCGAGFVAHGATATGNRRAALTDVCCFSTFAAAKKLLPSFLMSTRQLLRSCFP